MHILLLCVNYNCAPAIEDMLRTVAPKFRKNVEVILVDNSGELDEKTPCLNLDDFKRLHLVSPGQNLGYFGGANAGYAARNLVDQADITMIVNPDILFSQSFFDDLITQAMSWPVDAGVIFPMVFDTNTQGDANPFLRRRPVVNYLNTRIFFFSSRLRFAFWMLLYRIKSKLQKQKAVAGSNNESSLTQTYAGHGSLFLFLPAYFRSGSAFTFESFLYAEEFFVAETCREAGLKSYHDTNLCARHVSHVSTAALPSEQRRKWQLQSLTYIRDRFF